MLKNCQMCGGNASSLKNKSYVYDSGEQFVIAVCPKCQEVHFQLLNKENK